MNAVTAPSIVDVGVEYKRLSDDEALDPMHWRRGVIEAYGATEVLEQVGHAHALAALIAVEANAVRPHQVYRVCTQLTQMAWLLGGLDTAEADRLCRTMPPVADWAHRLANAIQGVS